MVSLISECLFGSDKPGPAGMCGEYEGLSGQKDEVTRISWRKFAKRAERKVLCPTNPPSATALRQDCSEVHSPGAFMQVMHLFHVAASCTNT